MLNLDISAEYSWVPPSYREAADRGEKVPRIYFHPASAAQAIAYDAATLSWAQRSAEQRRTARRAIFADGDHAKLVALIKDAISEQGELIKASLSELSDFVRVEVDRQVNEALESGAEGEDVDKALEVATSVRASIGQLKVDFAGLINLDEVGMPRAALSEEALDADVKVCLACITRIEGIVAGGQALSWNDDVIRELTGDVVDGKVGLLMRLEPGAGKLLAVRDLAASIIGGLDAVGKPDSEPA